MTSESNSKLRPISDEQIAKRAYEIWLSRDCIHGFDTENWRDAERGLLQEWEASKADTSSQSSSPQNSE